jgi:hypothetical protein
MGKYHSYGLNFTYIYIRVDTNLTTHPIFSDNPVEIQQYGQ